MGFPLTILRPAGVYLLMSILYREACLGPQEVTERAAADLAAGEPLVGVVDVSKGFSDTLGHLRKVGLVRQCQGDVRGMHTRYHLTSLGEGLIGALHPLTDWAMSDFGFVVAATRVRLGLPPLTSPVPEPLRSERGGTGMALSLLSGVWSDTVMVYVDSAGPGGIGPQQLQNTVNAAIDASSGEDRVEKHLRKSTLHPTLHRLVAKGLLARHEDPPRVLYRLTAHGRGLMDAWWRVSEGFGIPRDQELFQIMARSSGWFPHASKA